MMKKRENKKLYIGDSTGKLNKKNIFQDDKN